MMSDICTRLDHEIRKAYIGDTHTLQALVVAFLCGGHVLLEGAPGLAKTTLAHALAQAVDAQFRRIQFTADLMPADITGSSLYRISDGDFKFIPGPVFTHILLADEINRAPARTQSALLEAMQEGQVTADGCTHPLPDPFFVIATQNTLEERGTFPLPLSELDRFMFRLRLDYPTEAQERQILRLSTTSPSPIIPQLDPTACLAARADIARIHVSDPIVEYISDLIRATRTAPGIISGASPRAGVMLLRAARGFAWSEERDFVSPEDVARATPLTLNHRLVLSPASPSVDEVIRNILARTAFH